MWKKFLIILPMVLLLAIVAYFSLITLSMNTDNSCQADDKCPFAYVCVQPPFSCDGDRICPAVMPPKYCANPFEVLMSKISINKQTDVSSSNSDDINNALAENCQIENCHGLDIECGAEAPEYCTEEYQLGDFCRQFAECGIKNGKCQQIKNSEFRKCKACVSTCLDFECEADCRKEFE